RVGEDARRPRPPGGRAGRSARVAPLSEAPPPAPPAVRVAVDLTSQLAPLTGVGVFADAVVRHLAVRPDGALTAYAVTWRRRGRPGAVRPPRRPVRGPRLAAPPAPGARRRPRPPPR